MPMTATQAQQLYVAYFNRPADTLGLAYWMTKDAAAASAAFAASTEYAATYAGMSTAARVDAIYTNLFGRPSEPDGLKFWGGLIESGKITVSDAVTAIAKGAQGTDLTAYNNKVKAAEAFTTALDTSAEIVAYSGTAANAAAKTWLSGVTTDATLTTATTTAALNASIAGVTTASVVSSGSAYALTDKSDNFTGTSGNDVFTGDIATLGAGDSIVGGNGTDTLNFTGTTAAALPVANISGVEVFNIRQTTAALASTDLSLFSGVNTVNLDRSNQAATFVNMAKDGTYGVVGNGAVTNAGALAIGYVDAATAANVAFSGGTLGAQAVTLTGVGILSQTISSTGAANVTGAFAGAASATSTTINATTGLTTGAATNLGATLTINGAGAVNLSANGLANTVTTINAAGNSGGVTATLSNLVSQKVTGSSGNDSFTSGALVLTTGSVNAGDGNDTLVIGANVGNVNTTALAAKYTGFETLSLSGTLDMALIAGITAVELTNAATLSNMSAAQAGSVTITANAVAGTGDAQSFSLKDSSGKADVLSIIAGTGKTTAAATDIAALGIDGFETLNVKANAGPTSVVGAGGTGRDTLIGALTADSLTTINLTGTSVNMSNINTSKAVTINATALTGDGATTPAGLTVAGLAKVGSTINGSEFADSFTIGAEGSAYNGNGGDDAISATVTLLVADGTEDGTINGGAGKDTLTLTNTTGYTMTDNHFFKLSGLEALTLSATGAGDVAITTGSAFNSAFANGVTLTTGAIAATQDVTLAAGLSNVNTTVTVVSTLIAGTAAEINNIVTGSGTDKVTFTAANWVGINNAAQGTISISTGAGADTIAVTVGTSAGLNTAAPTGQAVTITAGTGADTITLTGTNGVYITTANKLVFASGDTGTTVGTFDTVTGTNLGDGTLIGDLFEFAGTGTVGTLGTSVDFGTILSHSITNGVALFSTNATYAAGTKVNASNLGDVVGYLAANTGTADAVAFLYDNNGDGTNDGTMVYSNMSADGLVYLDGTTVLGLNATPTTVTAGYIIIS